MKTVLFSVACGILLCAYTAPAQRIDIGSRLELLIDDYLIDHMNGDVELLLHHPVPREIVMVHDAPWEGSASGYHTVFKDGGLYRMYYHAWHLDPQQGKLNIPHDPWGAYAESKDGIHWVKPELGLFEYEGSKTNNIVWMGRGGHDFSPFKDTNPNCPPDAQYKTIASTAGEPHGVLAIKSADAIHWSLMQDLPVMTKGAFDTQNIAFWDPTLGAYRAYIRDFHDGIRDIRTTTSTDFINWTDPVMIQFPGRRDVPLYTNQVKPYDRAPHILIGFPTRYTERGWSPSMEALPEPEHRKLRSSSSDRYGMAITDALLMTSRDGVTFNQWDEAFLRPGLRTKNNWSYGDNYIAWHAVETVSNIEDAPSELSLYATESYWTGTSSLLRRFTLRMDGFVSAHSGGDGGELVTKPLIFQGINLVLNFSTSAAGVIRIEIQDETGAPIEGFALADAPEIFGDTLDRIAPWKDRKDLASLAGQPVRLRFVMQDADLYAFQFSSGAAAAEPYHIVVAPVGPDNPRNSEAAIIPIKDGALLLGWTEFYAGNGADHGPARISGKISKDGGKTWGDKFTLVQNDGGCNVMEVNFLRLKDGRIALFYCQKNTESTDCRVMMRSSADEGATWSAAKQISPDNKYTGLTNGRGIRLKSGRILLEAWEGGDSYCYLSDDDGKTWRESQRVKPGNGCWEPACIELKDGRVMMLMRTQLGGQYKSISTDGGETWTAPAATPLEGTAAPVSISRIPTTGDLLAIWNHNPGASTRNPLTAAVSNDEGETWQQFPNIEDKQGDAWAYPAVTWVGDQALLTYFNYTGGLSLQLKIIPAQWFYETK